ncbi:MAG TPA: hypothetical protein PLR25_12300, partial [Planctomycetaceae bacterium]|nr:hypothetical protein [Planctomycetaceae bacterium]
GAARPNDSPMVNPFLPLAYEVFVCPHSADKMLDANRSRHWTIGQNGSTVNIPDWVAGEVRAKFPDASLF